MNLDVVRGQLCRFGFLNPRHQRCHLLNDIFLQRLVLSVRTCPLHPELEQRQTNERLDLCGLVLVDKLRQRVLIPRQNRIEFVGLEHAGEGFAEDVADFGGLLVLGEGLASQELVVGGGFEDGVITGELGDAEGEELLGFISGLKEFVLHFLLHPLGVKDGLSGLLLQVHRIRPVSFDLEDFDEKHLRASHDLGCDLLPHELPGLSLRQLQHLPQPTPSMYPRTCESSDCSSSDTSCSPCAVVRSGSAPH